MNGLLARAHGQRYATALWIASLIAEGWQTEARPNGIFLWNDVQQKTAFVFCVDESSAVELYEAALELVADA